MQYLMLMGRKAKPESPEEMAMVHHALENPTRRRMLILMNEGHLTVDAIAKEVGDRMLDYQLHRLELAGLLEVHDGQITLTEAGLAYGRLVKLEKEKGGAEKIRPEDL
jgi:DNA-binding transcriptional ArsR family regulator